MPLSAGTRLGHYDVIALLGEGGMGQVWQATDTQLNRQVALKILSDPDRGRAGVGIMGQLSQMSLPLARTRMR